jgi:hypothetical protein
MTASKGRGKPFKASPRSLAIANRGVRTSHDLANLTSALMSDMIEGALTPKEGNAVCNAVGRLLRTVASSTNHRTHTAE